MKITPDILLHAYAEGLFPMAESRGAEELHWFDPPLRGILPLDAFHVPRRLREKMRRGPFRLSFDEDFAGVIRACADTRDETWINDEIIALYTALHRAGFAHSAEAWKDGKLAGGVYGVSLGAAFFGESMFSTETDASKTALVHLMERLRARGYALFDTQYVNDHLKQFGVREIPREEYKKLLKAAIAKQDVRFR